jgi:Domain of unknown function (DUF4142)
MTQSPSLRSTVNISEALPTHRPRCAKRRIWQPCPSQFVPQVHLCRRSDDACSKADKVKVPADLDKEHQAKLNALKAAGKSAFDKMYMADQLTVHKGRCFPAMRLMRKRGTESLRGQDAPDTEGTLGGSS